MGLKKHTDGLKSKLKVNMSDKYIFLDRDGTIIEDKYYTYKIGDIEFLPRAIEGLWQLKKIGYQFIIVTNQAGVALGYYSKNVAFRFHNEVLNRLKKVDIEIKKSYFCFHSIDNQCYCRKPKPGMVFKAVKKFAIDLESSIFIGDKDSDIKLGKNCRGKTFLINNDQYDSISSPDYKVDNLYQVYEILKGL